MLLGDELAVNHRDSLDIEGGGDVHPPAGP